MCFLPSHRLTILTFSCTTKSLLVSIEHTGHSGKGHLQQNREFHLIYILAAKSQVAADIVAVQQVQLRIQGILTIAEKKGGYVSVKGFSPDSFFCEESTAITAKIVVHSAVQHITV